MNKLYIFELYLITNIASYKKKFTDSELTTIVIQNILTAVEILNGSPVL
jgi:hypothetical protein